MKKINLLFGMSVILFWVMACDKSEVSSQKEIVPSQIDPNAKILEFATIKDFYAKVDETSKMSKESLDTWEKQAGFYSMRRLFNDILEEEYLNLNKEEAIIKENPSLKSTLKHETSKLFLENKEWISYSPDGGFSMNVSEQSYGNVVNKYGLVIIGGVIHQFTKDKIKAIKNGDKNLITSLANFDKEGDYENGIGIRNTSFNVVYTNKSLRVDSERGCSSRNGDYRLNAWLTTGATSIYTSNGQWYTNLYTVLTQQHEKYTWYGAWVNHLTNNYGANGYINVSHNIYTRYPLGTGSFDTGFSQSVNLGNYAGNSSYSQYWFRYDQAAGIAAAIHTPLSGTNITNNFLDCSCNISY